MKRIAVKIGSNVLTRKDGALDITRMSALVDQVADLHRQGVEIVLISTPCRGFRAKGDKSQQKTGFRIGPATVFGGRTGQADQPILRVIQGTWYDLRASAYHEREFREPYALFEPKTLYGSDAGKQSDSDRKRKRYDIRN